HLQQRELDALPEALDAVFVRVRFQPGYVPHRERRERVAREDLYRRGDFDAIEGLADSIDHGERRQRPKRRVQSEPKAPTQLDRGEKDSFHESVKPTPPLAQK